MVSGLGADYCSWLRGWRLEGRIGIGAFRLRRFTLPECRAAFRTRRLAVCQKRRRPSLLSLGDPEDLVGRHLLKVIFAAARSEPTHVQFLNLRRFAESETQPPAL